jgi:F-box interacting protein
VPSRELGRMVTYLPEVLEVKILSWLPPKSLIRFKCVCKRWHALIGSPDFLSKNLLNHSIINQNSCDPRRLILFIARDKSYLDIYSFRSYDSLHCASQTPLNLPPAPLCLSVIASCNGLLCLWDSRSEIYLWNPATSSELKALPAAPSRSARGGFIFYDVGFGFDSVSNDFKVILLHDNDGERFLKAEVYSLKSGCWRLLDMSMIVSLNFRLHLTFLKVELDGVFLWYANKEWDFTDDRIIAFDFSEEEFITMTFPDLADEDMRILTKLKGSVAMVVFPYLAKDNMYLHIWVMLEFGFSESWTRLLSIGLPLHLEWPLGFWKNGELFMKNREGQVVLYDLLAKTETDLQFEGIFPRVVDCNFVQLEGMAPCLKLF